MGLGCQHFTIEILDRISYVHMCRVAVRSTGCALLQEQDAIRVAVESDLEDSQKGFRVGCRGPSFLS